jgi:hypothetical protein
MDRFAASLALTEEPLLSRHLGGADAGAGRRKK